MYLRCGCVHSWRMPGIPLWSAQSPAAPYLHAKSVVGRTRMQQHFLAGEIKHPVTAPRVSIIVPCHNGGRFLDGLLASLGAQTFRDFETIIVDNGSTEGATCEKL